MLVWAKDKKTTWETWVFVKEDKYITFETFWRNALFEVDSIPEDKIFSGDQCIKTWDGIAEGFGDTNTMEDIEGGYEQSCITDPRLYLKTLGYDFCDHYFTVDGDLISPNLQPS